MRVCVCACGCVFVYLCVCGCIWECWVEIQARQQVLDGGAQPIGLPLHFRVWLPVFPLGAPRAEPTSCCSAGVAVHAAARWYESADAVPPDATYCCCAPYTPALLQAAPDMVPPLVICCLC